MTIRERVPLAPLTTFGIGGAARFFAEARSIREVEEAFAFARERALPVFVLGGGSNILVADEGFDGLVLSPQFVEIAFDEREETMTVSVGAGVALDAFVARSIERGCVGLECLSGIPGSVGGAVVANAGAYGAQMSDLLTEVRAYDRERGEVHSFANAECDFSYHDSMFSHSNGRYVVLDASFTLPTSGTSRLSYRDNRFNLGALALSLGREPSLEEVRAEILRMRGEKGMVAGAFRSAGSFFHMPFVSAEQYAIIEKNVRTLDPEKEERLRPWAWKQADGSYKLAGGFLLEYTEFKKGYARGAAGISPKHTLSIVNLGGAAARDIAALARDMQDTVERMFGVRFEREVEYVGHVERA